jgi:hypothetical protein
MLQQVEMKHWKRKRWMKEPKLALLVAAQLA